MSVATSTSAALFVESAPDARSAPLEMPAPIDVEVARLTARLREGEEKAWREFHATYFDRLLRYLLVVCAGDEQAAREALQAALIKVVRNVRRFDRAEAWWSWLTVVARSCVIDAGRGRSRYRALLERYAGSENGSLAEEAQNDPLPRLLDECLEALPVAERDLLAAKYRDGHSVAALAAESGCSEKAMESRLARLRQRVRAHLLQRLRDEN